MHLFRQMWPPLAPANPLFVASWLFGRTRVATMVAPPMKQNGILTVTSLVAILLTTFHHSDDVVRGMAPAGLSGNLPPVLFLLVWVYGTLVLAERRSGYVINLVASLLASGLPLVHMIGSGLAGERIGSADGAFFFTWTLIALGVTANFSAILSVRGLWSLRRATAT